jgi:FKBP-type peptidyl-prolyl cis-trans isomerase
VDLDAMVETSSGLFYKDVTMGMGREARRGDRVQLHYIGAFIDGTVFERSTDLGPPIEFRLGAREVIRGWDEGVRGMREGGLRQLVIPPQLAYGSGDREAGIPPGATLVFQVQLVKVGGG